jgi:hypothetical protein
MVDMNTMKERVDKALEEVHRAEKEIGILKRELAAGTLDRKKLESGLEKLDCYVRQIPSHVPPFSK